MRTSSRNFAILLFDEVEILDFAGALQIASVAGRHWNWRPFRILTVAEQAGLLETRNQIRVEAKWSLDTCPPVELLLIPGGYGARRAAKNPQLLQWCRTQGEVADKVLVIGAGAAIAGAAGLLSGVEVAVGDDVAQWLEKEPWVQDAEQPAILQTKRFMVSSQKFLSCAHGAGSSELGLLLVEHCLGASSATKMRAEFHDTNNDEEVPSEKPGVEIIRP